MLWRKMYKQKQKTHFFNSLESFKDAKKSCEQD